uniref:E2F transcription factor CC-MB domain-containing protein n=1 Tax=Parascaris equorum TaxID=6256 RepID=A0A914RK24_PAREQ
MIEKMGKNSIRWKTGEELGSRGLDAQRLRDENRELEKHEAELDFLISDVANALKLAKEDPTDKPYRYIDQTLIAIKAPTESYSSVEVTDPVETGILVRNENREQLQAFLCPDSDAIKASNLSDDQMVLFMSPLKMVTDGAPPQSGISSNADISEASGALMSLDPVQEQEPYIFSLNVNEGVHQLYEW